MQREACLRQEFAELYPSIVAGRWYTAAAAAGEVKATSIINGGGDLGLPERVLNEAHFLFRGGAARHGIWLGMRTRRTDRWTFDDATHGRSSRLRPLLAS